MSQPNPQAERAEFEAELKKTAYSEAGLTLTGKDEWVGTKEQWKEADDNLEESINKLMDY